MDMNDIGSLSELEIYCLLEVVRSVRGLWGHGTEE